MFKLTKSIPLLQEIVNRDDLTLADAVVYCALRFKLNLSLKTGFKDKDGNYYVIHQQKDIMDDTGLSKRKIIDAMEKLESEKVGLIRREKIGRSFKIYFNEYEVDERYVVGNNVENDVQNASNTPNPSDNIPEEENGLQGANIADLPIVDITGDNLGIISCVADVNDLIGAENALIETIENVKGAENAPNIEIGAEKAPYKKNLYKKNYNTSSNTNYNNLTLLKGHRPKVEIDHDLYTTFSKCFSKKPSVAVKNAIQGLINSGVDKELIIEIMNETGRNGWTWGSALNKINGLVKNDCMTIDKYIDLQLEAENVNVISEDRIKEIYSYAGLMLHSEPSEIDDADQIAF